MTHELRFRFIGERNPLLNMEMSFFEWNMGMSFLWYALYITESARPQKSG
jgi:hypothetical protein